MSAEAWTSARQLSVLSLSSQRKTFNKLIIKACGATPGQVLIAWYVFNSTVPIAGVWLDSRVLILETLPPFIVYVTKTRREKGQSGAEQACPGLQTWARLSIARFGRSIV